MQPPLLEARGLRVGFRDSAWRLGPCDLAFSSGTLAVLAGSNGAGKSVLAKSLAALISPSEGQVLFSGEELRRMAGSPASRVAYMNQDARLGILGDSLLEDCAFGPSALGFGADEARRAAAQALEAVGLAGKLHDSPDTLSGGELRRLGIAGALSLDPQVLILDEPFANLDWTGCAALLRVLLEQRRHGRCCLVLTHELDKILGLADRLIIITEGRIAADGSPAALLDAGIERFGLRDPRRAGYDIGSLHWLS